MLKFLLIGFGSFLGGIMRYSISNLIMTKYQFLFPVGTFTVNLLGCFCIGLLYGYYSKGSISDSFYFFLIVGVLGGFTTFSTFSNELFILMKSGKYLYAGIYSFSSIIVGLSLTYIGFLITTIKQVS